MALMRGVALLNVTQRGGQMDAPKLLIVYASSYGQTAKIAGRMGEILSGRGFQVTVENAREPSGVRLADFDGVIVGASMIARGHQPAVREFIRANVAALNEMPSAFFSVCASAGSKYPANRDAAVRLRDAFLAQTQWAPDLTASIAGAINFTKYNFLLRWYMKRASAMNGGSTDTSRDHEYTDWAQVDRFAGEFARVLERTPAAV
jgi:menaquinone-dependent protoporphyrinogen oxidase